MLKHHGRLALLALAVFSLSPAIASASLTAVTLTWYWPNASTIYEGPEMIEVGSTVSCVGQTGGAICNAYPAGGNHSFAIGTDTITYTGSNDPEPAFDNTFDAFDFSGLTFNNGGLLTSYALSNNTAGLTASDITFGASFIEVNMESAPTNSTFTLTLNPIVAAVPEPSALFPLALTLGALLTGGTGRLAPLAKPLPQRYSR